MANYDSILQKMQEESKENSKYDGILAKMAEIPEEDRYVNILKKFEDTGEKTKPFAKGLYERSIFAPKKDFPLEAQKEMAAIRQEYRDKGASKELDKRNREFEEKWGVAVIPPEERNRLFKETAKEAWEKTKTLAKGLYERTIFAPKKDAPLEAQKEMAAIRQEYRAKGASKELDKRNREFEEKWGVAVIPPEERNRLFKETAKEAVEKAPETAFELGAELTSGFLFDYQKPLKWAEKKGYTGRVDNTMAKLSGNLLRTAGMLQTAGMAGGAVAKAISAKATMLGKYAPIVGKVVGAATEGGVFWGGDETINQAQKILDDEKEMSWNVVGRVGEETVYGGAKRLIYFNRNMWMRVPLALAARAWREQRKLPEELTEFYQRIEQSLKKAEKNLAPGPTKERKKLYDHYKQVKTEGEAKIRAQRLYRIGLEGLFALFIGPKRFNEQSEKMQHPSGVTFEESKGISDADWKLARLFNTAHAQGNIPEMEKLANQVSREGLKRKFLFLIETERAWVIRKRLKLPLLSDTETARGGNLELKAGMQVVSQHLPPEFYAATPQTQEKFLSTARNVLEQKEKSIAQAIDSAIKATDLTKLSLTDASATVNFNKSAENISKLLDPETKFPEEFRKLESVQRAKAISQITKKINEGKTIEEAVKESHLPVDPAMQEVPGPVQQEGIIRKSYNNIPANQASLEVEKLKSGTTVSAKDEQIINKIQKGQKVTLIEQESLNKRQDVKRLAHNLPMPTDPPSEEFAKMIDEDGYNTLTGNYVDEKGIMNLNRIAGGLTNAYKETADSVQKLYDSGMRFQFRGHGATPIKQLELTSMLYNDGLIADETGKFMTAAFNENYTNTLTRKPDKITEEEWETIARAAERYSPGQEMIKEGDKEVFKFRSKEFLAATIELQKKGIDVYTLGQNFAQAYKYLGELEVEMGGLNLKFPESFIVGSFTELKDIDKQIGRLQEKLDTAHEKYEGDKLSNYLQKTQEEIEQLQAASKEIKALREEAPWWTYVGREVMDKYGTLLERKLEAGKFTKADAKKFTDWIKRYKRRKIPLRELADPWFENMGGLKYENPRTTLARRFHDAHKRYTAYSWLRDNVRQDPNYCLPSFHPDTELKKGEYILLPNIHKPGTMSHKIFGKQRIYLNELDEDVYRYDIYSRSKGFEFAKQPIETEGAYVRFQSDNSEYKLLGSGKNPYIEADMMVHKTIGDAIKELSPMEPGPYFLQLLENAHWVHKRLTYVMNVGMIINDMWQLAEELYFPLAHLKELNRAKNEYIGHTGYFDVFRLSGLYGKEYVNIYEDIPRLINSVLEDSKGTVMEPFFNLLKGVEQDVLRGEIFKALEDASLPMWTAHDVFLHYKAVHNHEKLGMPIDQAVNKALDSLGGGGLFTKRGRRVSNLIFKTAEFGGRMLKREKDMLMSTIKQGEKLATGGRYPKDFKMNKADRNKLIGRILKHIIVYALGHKMFEEMMRGWKPTHQGRLEKEYEYELFSPETWALMQKQLPGLEGKPAPIMRKTKVITFKSGGWFIERLMNRNITTSAKYRYNYLLNVVTNTWPMLKGQDVTDHTGKIRVDGTASIPTQAKQWAAYMIKDFFQIPEKFDEKESDIFLTDMEKFFQAAFQSTIYFKDPNKNATFWQKMIHRHLLGEPLSIDTLEQEAKAEKHRQRKATEALTEIMAERAVATGDRTAILKKEVEMVEAMIKKHKIKTVGDLERTFDKLREEKSRARAIFKTLPTENKIVIYENLKEKEQAALADLYAKALYRYRNQ